MAFEAPRDLLALAISDDDMRRTPKPVIVNVVATYNFSNPIINMELLTMRLPGIGFNPRRFAAAKMRLPRPMTLAFCGGCAVCPGSRSVMDARIAALRFTEYQLRSGEYVQYRRFKVQNIVMSVWMPFEVDMTSIIEEWSAHAEYTPSRFPGASFRFGCGDGIIVFNVFVTGRVIITRSRNEQHSYRAWFWFYTNVLVRHQLGTAAGTTSSSAYRMASHRRRDTFADDCLRISSRHIRRRDGPMARSAYYSAFIAQTPRTARAHAPATMRVAAATAAAAAAAAAATTTTTTTTTLVDVCSHFLGHTAACPFMRGNEVSWYDAYDDDTIDTDAVHTRAGCASMSREWRLEQLASAVGRERLERVHGDAAPFHGHTLACPLVRAPAHEPESMWRDERERLEAALGGVGVAGYTLDDVFRRHRDAGCFAADDDIDWTSVDAVASVARHVVSQLHIACHDFDDDDDDDDDDDGDDGDASAAALDAVMREVLDVDDVIDYEAQYRLDAIRDHHIDAATECVFSLESISL